MKLRGRLGALEEREFRLLWFSRVVSDFGDRFGTIGLAFAVLAIERSAAALAYVLAARTIASIALFLVAGVWADRLPRQRVMLASDVGRGIATAAMAVLLLTENAEIWHLVVLAAVYGAAEALLRPRLAGPRPANGEPRAPPAGERPDVALRATSPPSPGPPRPVSSSRSRAPGGRSSSTQRRSASARRSCS